MRRTGQESAADLKGKTVISDHADVVLVILRGSIRMTITNALFTTFLTVLPVRMDIKKWELTALLAVTSFLS